MSISQKLKQLFGKNLKFNEPLRKWTSFRIGGPAKYFLIAKNNDDLLKAINFVKKNKIKYFILGSGSNLLFLDKGFSGLIIKIKNQKLKIKNTNQKSKIVKVEAGEALSKLVVESVKAGLTGLEWAAGIPGSVGGAVYQNAGAFGSDLSKSIQRVIVLRKGKIIKLNKKQCCFAYRSSIFQKNKDIVLEIRLKLKKGKRVESQKLIKKHLDYRREKQPVGFSAGSVFKNLQFTIRNIQLLKQYPQLHNFKKAGIIPAGWLIENSGLKGLKIGDAQISEKHANFIINKGKAKAKDVLALISTAKKRVFKKFKVKLQEEIEVVKD